MVLSERKILVDKIISTMKQGVFFAMFRNGIKQPCGRGTCYRRCGRLSIRVPEKMLKRKSIFCVDFVFSFAYINM